MGTIKITLVRSLCTKSEVAVVLQCIGGVIEFLTPKDLRGNAIDARKLRDKYAAAVADLVAKGKTATFPNRKRFTPYERAVYKRDLFQGVLESFEYQLRSLGHPVPPPRAPQPPTAPQRAPAPIAFPQRAVQPVQQVQRPAPPPPALKPHKPVKLEDNGPLPFPAPQGSLPTPPAYSRRRTRRSPLRLTPTDPPR